MHLEEVVGRHAELTEQLSSGQLSPKEIVEVAKERANLDPIVECYQAMQSSIRERDENRSLLTDEDDEMKALAREEIGRLDSEIAALQDKLNLLLLPRDPNDEKNVILEIRAGTGGDEASLFAGQLFTMYSRYAATVGWRVELVSTADGGRGGFKEVIAQISGDAVFSRLKYEAGVHRVQRVPETESQGRVHTSACTVVVMPEAEEIDFAIDPNEVRCDYFRASGPGGQSVNTTDSAVRLTHIPTGLVVQCQDEKSQHKNKAKAMGVLRARLYDKQMAEQHKERQDAVKGMIGSGDRSEKIRTYNFPQDRCTDHRVGISVHGLPKLFSGDIGGLLDQVHAAIQAEQLKAESTGS